MTDLPSASGSPHRWTGRGARVVPWLTVLSLLLALARGAQMRPVLAAPGVVTSTADSGAGSLRQAITDAAVGDTITFSLSGCPCTITLTSGELAVTKNLTIQGPGAAVLTVSGNHASRVFSIAGGVTSTIAGLTIANGRAQPVGGVCNTNASCDGSGIVNVGTLTVNDSVITGNTAFLGGGIYNTAHLAINRTAFRGNSTTGAQGSGIYSTNNETDSTVKSSVTITDSTISGNGPDTGGAIEVDSTALEVTNSTISGNTNRGIVVHTVPQITGAGTCSNCIPASLTCLNCTIAANGGFGIELITSGGPTPSTARLKNTLVATNGAGNFGIRLWGTFTSQGNNLDSDGGSGFINGANGDIVGTSTAKIDPLIGPLANNSGPTPTHALLPGSPALDAGTSTGAPAADQRGVARPQNGAVDIGAFEARAFALAATAGSGQSAPATQPFTTPLQVRLTEGGTNPLVGAAITFTGPATGAGIAPAPASAVTDATGTASLPVTANAVAGSYTVTATIGALTAPFSLTNTPATDLSITITDGTTTAAPGGTTTYTIVVSNAGPSPVQGATVTDSLPAVITSSAWKCAGSSGGTCPSSGSGDLRASVDLPAGSTVTFTMTAVVSPTATGTLSVTAAVTMPAGVTELNPANNSATDVDTLVPTGDLSVSVSGPATVLAGVSTVTYHIVVTNPGPSPATGVGVNDSAPTGLTNVTWTCAAAGGATCPPAGTGSITTSVTLPANSFATFTLTGTASPGALGTLSNTASLTVPGGFVDPNPANNAATASTPITTSADLGITTTAGPAYVFWHQPVSFTVTVTNAGPSDAQDVVVTNPLPSDTSFVSASPSAGGTCATPAVGGFGTVTCTWAGATGPGTVRTLGLTVQPEIRVLLNPTNHATVSAATTDPNLANNSTDPPAAPAPVVPCPRGGCAPPPAPIAPPLNCPRGGCPPAGAAAAVLSPTPCPRGGCPPTPAAPTASATGTPTATSTHATGRGP